MKNAKLKAVSLILTLLVACTCLLFVGCNNGSDGYTVILKYEDGTLVNDIDGVTVQLCLVDGDNDVIYYGEKVDLDGNGKATFKNADKPDADQKYRIIVDNLPVGYTPLKDYYVKKPGTTVVTISDKITYTATAIDNDGNGVANVWLEVRYFDIEQQKDVSVQKAKTAQSGVAVFTFRPVQNVTTYTVGLGDSGETAGDIACPNSYEFVPEESPDYDGGTSKITFGSDLDATLVFNYYPDRFGGVNTPMLEYSRVHGTPEPVETNRAYTVALTANRYSYFAFCPYVGSEDEATDRLNATAASGIYRLTCDVGNANVTMYNYVGTRAQISTDENRIPDTVRYITGSMPAVGGYEPGAYTNGNYIELDLDVLVVRDENVFGLISDSNCTVTVSVTRTKDASYEIPVTNKVPAEYSADIADCSVVETGIMTPVPIASVASYVKDSNGIYHIDSESGATVYLVLTQPVDSTAAAISALPESDPRGNAVFTFDTAIDERGMTVTQTDYLDLVAAYASHVKNDYGVYPLNDELLEFLKCFHGFATENVDNVNLGYLMANCVYFRVEVVLAEENLTDGTNTVTVGTAPIRFKFTPKYTGKYAVRYNGNDDNVEIKIQNAANDFVTAISVSADFVYYEFDTTANSDVTFDCYYNNNDGGNSYSFDVIPVEMVISVTVPYAEDSFNAYELQFSAPAGTYTISYSGGDENVQIQNEDGGVVIGNNGEDTLTESDFTVSDDRPVTFLCLYVGASSEQTYTITITLKTE